MRPSIHDVGIAQVLKAFAQPSKHVRFQRRHLCVHHHTCGMDSWALLVTGLLLHPNLGTLCHTPLDRALANKVNDLFCTCAARPKLQEDQILEMYISVLHFQHPCLMQALPSVN